MTTVYIRTYGCSTNASDSETIAGLLNKSGYNLTDNLERADLVIINTCIVKAPTQTAVLKFIKEVETEYKKPLIIAGCMPQAMPQELIGYSLIGVTQLSNIAMVVEETLNGNSVVLIAPEKNPRLNLPIIRRNKIVEIIPICSGCMGDPCSYCIVKKARGELISYEPKEIINRAENAIEEGAKELWLTAQDTGCYGKDIKTTLPKLLKQILELDGDFYIRIGMLNPNHVLENIDELITVFKHPKMFKFLHIPVQAGNDEILERMKRKYTAKEFKEIIKKFRQEIPDITISTDVICGFPRETKEQFMETIELMKEIKPDVLNISKYWNRPGTQAERMIGQVPGLDISNRSRHMTTVFEWIGQEKNKKWIGWTGEVLIDEAGKEGTMTARNYAYKPIIVPGEHEIGKKVRVKITRVSNIDLRAEIIQ